MGLAYSQVFWIILSFILGYADSTTALKFRDSAYSRIKLIQYIRQERPNEWYCNTMEDLLLLKQLARRMKTAYRKAG